MDPIFLKDLDQAQLQVSRWTKVERKTQISDLNEWIELVDRDEIIELENHHLGFIILLRGKFRDSVFKEELETRVKNTLTEWYDDPNMFKKIMLHSINLDLLSKQNWQIMYEDDNIDPIVHVYFKGWEIDYLAITS